MAQRKSRRTQERNEDQAQQRRPQRKSSSGAPIAALGIVFALAAMVIVGIMATKQARTEKPQEEVAVYEDPWEGLPPDVPAPRKAPTSTGSSSSSFSPDFSSQSSAWAEAESIQQEASKLHIQSSDLRLAGDAEWRTVAKEAKELYEEAVEKARAYRVVFVSEFGESAPETTRLDKKIDKWNKALFGLHKTVG